MSTGRREFLTTALGAAAGLAVAAAAPPAAFAATRFKLNYAPHFGLFEAHAGPDLLEQLRFAAGEGFRAWEDNGMRQRPVSVQESIAREMARLGMEMGVFVANDHGLDRPILTSGEPAMQEAFLADIRASVEVARRVNAKFATLVVGTEHHRLQRGYQTANVIEALRRAAEICEPAGPVLVVEALNPWRDHPQYFATSMHETYALIKAVASPAVKLLFDIYHAQIMEGNILPSLDRCWDEVAYIQAGDHPGRNEPGTGEINYRNVFRHVHGKGYAGIIGMEHGKSAAGREGERAVINAYLAADDF